VSIVGHLRSILIEFFYVIVFATRGQSNLTKSASQKMTT